MNAVGITVAGITTGMVYALVALGYHLIFRATRVIDLAQGEKLALGGLIALSAIRVLGLSIWPAIVVACIIGYVLGWIYERGVIRFTYARGGVVAIIATVGVAIVLANVRGLLWGRIGVSFPYPMSGEARVVHLLGTPIPEQHLWVWGLVLVVFFAIRSYLSRSLAGQAVVAAADEQFGAKVVGIRVDVMRARVFGLAFALAVLGGIAIAPFVLAGGEIGFPIAVKAFAGAVIGGLTSPGGVVIGAILVGLLETATGAAFSYGYRDPAVYSLLILVLLVRPNGLFGAPIERVG